MNIASKGAKHARIFQLQKFINMIDIKCFLKTFIIIGKKIFPVFFLDFIAKVT